MPKNSGSFRIDLPPSWQLTWPLSFALFGFIAATFTGNVYILSAVAFLGLLGLGKFLEKAEPIKLLLVILASGMLFFLATLRVYFAAPGLMSTANLPSGEYLLSGQVADITNREFGTELLLNHIVFGQEARTDRVLVLARDLSGQWQVGDQLKMVCAWQATSMLDSKSYARYLESHGIYQTCATDDQPVHTGRAVNLPAIAWGLRENFTAQAKSRFTEPYGTLLTGLLIGDVQFSPHYTNVFKRTGVTHMVAASGTNVALVIAFLFGLLNWIGVKRQDALPVLIVGIIFFVIIAGGGAAVVRAGVMASMVLLAKTRGQNSPIRNVLLITAIVLLSFNPNWLRGDIGFQLSVASTIGLVYIAPTTKRWFSFIPETLGIQEAFATTMAAMLATLPITILSFNQVSIVAPIVNLLVLPALPYVLFTGLAALVLPVYPLFTALPWLGLEWVLRITDYLAATPFAQVSMPPPAAYALSAFSIIILCFLLRRSASTSALR